MAKATENDSINAGAIATAKARRSSEEKWGRSVMALGFCIIPSLLLRAQRRLKLTPVQLAVLLQLADYWWENERKPWPSKQSLSDRLGISPRQVQRHLADLENMGLIVRNQRTGINGGKLSNEYDLSGLVKRLQALAPEFQDAEDTVRKARKAAAAPGFRPKAANE